MTATPAAGVLGPSVGNVSQSAFKEAIEQLVSVQKEMIGGAGVYSTLTIASGTLSLIKDYSVFVVNGEGSAADDLANIVTGTSGLRNGMVIGIIGAGVNLTHKNAAGGSGQMYTRSGSDYVQRGTSEIVWYRYHLATTSWYQIFPDVYSQLKLMLGAIAAATLSPTSNVVTPSSALILIDSASAQNVNQIARTNFPDNGPLLLVGCANATYARTLKHATGGSGVDGRLFHTDSADIVLNATTKWVLYYAFTDTDGKKAWQEITRFGFTTSSGSWTVVSKNTDFNVGSARERYVVDTSAAAKTATFNAATSGNYTDEWEFVVSGPYDLILVPYQTTPEFIRDGMNKDTASFRIPANTSKWVRALAIVDGGVNGIQIQY